MVSLPSGSLEDCLTNVFSLAELNGLRWVRLVPKNENPPVKRLDDDPVLRAYSVCRENNLTAMWRRSPNPTLRTFENEALVKASPAVSVAASRELWIFWYGDTRPSQINSFLSDGLAIGAEDSWEQSGFEYPFRRLFYGAIHNIIERSVLESGMLRFGRWFCQPQSELITDHKDPRIKYITAYGFEFFITDGTKVCLQIRTQRQPPLLRLSRKRLLKNVRQPVILSPWSMRGVLLPNQPLLSDDSSEMESDKPKEDNNGSLNLSSFAGLFSTPEKEKQGDTSKRQLNNMVEEQLAQWRKLTGLVEDSVASTSEERLPKMVMVEVDGLPMLYPTCLVAIVADEIIDDAEEECQQSKADDEEGEPTFDFVEIPSGSSYNHGCAGLRSAKRLFEDALIAPTDRTEDRWSFNDHSQKEFCMCKACSLNDDANLPSVSPAVANSAFTNPQTPHSVQKISEPPSVPPTSIESVASTSGDNKHLRRVSRVRYKQPIYSSVIDAKESPRCLRLERELEDVKSKDGCERTAWVNPYCINESANWSASEKDDVYQLGPVFRPGAEDWDGTDAPVRAMSPFTPITCLTPATSDVEDEEERTQKAADRASFNYIFDSELRDHLEVPAGMHLTRPRDKVIGPVAEEQPESPTDSPHEPVEDTSILKELLFSDSPEEPQVVDEGSEPSSSDEEYDFEAVGKEQRPCAISAASVSALETLLLTTETPYNVFDEFPSFNEPSDLFDVGDLPIQPEPFQAVDNAHASTSANDNDIHQYEAQIQRIRNPLASTPGWPSSNPAPMISNDFSVEPISMSQSVPPVTNFIPTPAPQSVQQMEVDPPQMNPTPAPCSAVPNFPSTSTAAFGPLILDVSSDGDDEDSNDKHEATELLKRHRPFASGETSRAFFKDVMAALDKSAHQLTDENMVPSTWSLCEEDLEECRRVAALKARIPMELVDELLIDVNNDYDVMYKNLWGPMTVRDPEEYFETPVYEPMERSPEAVRSTSVEIRDAEMIAIRRAQNDTPLQRQAMMNAQRQGFNPMPYGHSPQINGMSAIQTPEGPSPIPPHRMPGGPPNSFTLYNNNAGGSVQLTDPMMNGFSMPMTPGQVGSVGSASNQYGHSPSAPRSLIPPSPFNQPQMPPSNGFPGSMIMPTDPLSANPFNIPLMPAVMQSSSDMLRFDMMQKGFAFVAAALLRDSLLNLHYDTVFESCPLCSCTESIRSSEFGVYLSLPDDAVAIDFVLSRHPDRPNETTRVSGFLMKDIENNGCGCAFSAVRHRYLCDANTNLFYDDVREATGALPLIPADGSGLDWFNPLSSNNWELVDVLRTYLLGHDLATQVKANYYLGDVPLMLENGESVNRLDSPRDQYFVSGVDQTELEFVVNSAIRVSAMDPSLKATNSTGLQSIVHPWGIQIADKVQQPSDVEVNCIMQQIVPVLENATKFIRASSDPAAIMEGPLSWKTFHRKATKIYKSALPEGNDEDMWHAPEPIPNIVVGSERDCLVTTPQAVWAWDRIGLTPYSWPKNVLYLAVVPDHPVVVDKTRIFLEDYSLTYERHRLGRHHQLPFQSKQPSELCAGVGEHGLVKVPLAQFHLPSLTSVTETDRITLMNRVKAYVSAYTQMLSIFFKGVDSVFEKECLFRAIYRDCFGEHFSSAASVDHLPNGNPEPFTPVPYQENAPTVNLGYPGSSGPNVQHRLPVVHPFYEDPMVPKSVDTGTEELLHNDEGNFALPHVIVVYVVNPFSFGSNGSREAFTKMVNIAFLRSFNKIVGHLEPIRRPRLQFEILELSTVFDYAGYCCDPLQEGLQAMTPLSLSDPLTSANVLRKLAFSVYSQPRHVTMDCVRVILAKSMTRFGPASQATDLLDTLNSSGSANDPMFYRVPCNPYILAPRTTGYEITTKGNLLLTNPEEKVLFCTYCLVRDRFLVAAVTDDRGELLDTNVVNLSRATTGPGGSASKTTKTSIVGEAIQHLWSYIQGCLSRDTKNWRLVVGRFGKIGHGEFKAWTHILSKRNLSAYNNLFRGKEKEAMTPAPGSASFLNNSHGAASCKTCMLNTGFAETPALVAACLLSTEAEPVLKVFPELLSDPKSKMRLTPSDFSVTHIMVFPTSPYISNDAGNAADVIEEEEGNDLFDNLDFDDANQGDNDMDNVIEDLDFNVFNTAATNSLTNQPIAVGYSVSTAPAPDVPDWFWAMCPNARDSGGPVHLRSALHLNVPHIQHSDDNFMLGNNKVVDSHPLDSNVTDEVLKYILQTYNDLSWLNMDIVTGQRKSCLPIHMQALLRLYHGACTTLL